MVQPSHSIHFKNSLVLIILWLLPYHAGQGTKEDGLSETAKKKKKLLCLKKSAPFFLLTTSDLTVGLLLLDSPGGKN